MFTKTVAAGGGGLPAVQGGPFAVVIKAVRARRVACFVARNAPVAQLPGWQPLAQTGRGGLRMANFVYIIAAAHAPALRRVRPRLHPGLAERGKFRLPALA